MARVDADAMVTREMLTANTAGAARIWAWAHGHSEDRDTGNSDFLRLLGHSHAGERWKRKGIGSASKDVDYLVITPLVSVQQRCGVCGVCGV